MLPLKSTKGKGIFDKIDEERKILKDKQKAKAKGRKAKRIFWLKNKIEAFKNEIQAPKIQPPQINFQFQVPSILFPNIQAVNNKIFHQVGEMNLLYKNIHHKYCKYNWFSSFLVLKL